jgi:sigma-B regulation protein RsbU (phosphoserine phosphatase)
LYLFKTNGSWYPIVIPVFFQTPLAFIGAVTIEHGRLFKEVLVKLRMEEDLSVARDVQMSMLPATCPKVEGYQIAASSTPAREVGGDFFDFFEIGEGRLGLIIGDVTGKSVSGALIMSASRSVFRMLSEEKLTVGEIMMRANRRLKKDIKSGMFVALLYAVLDAEKGGVGLCSAGQTQPVLMSAKTAEVKLVETLGDTFPLGILEDASYEETRLQLEPGDKVVFYTDGIVEAMNKKEEIYGFERLQEVIKTSKASEAEALMNDIITSVSNFTGNAPQHDDLTLIIVSVDK